MFLYPSHFFLHIETNYSEAAVSSFPYCTESSLNFSTSATAYSEDDAEYATGRRNKTSRVNITVLERPKTRYHF